MWFQASFKRNESKALNRLLNKLRNGNYKYEKYSTANGYAVEYKKVK